MTSAEEFTEEKAFPPAVLDTPMLRLGGILTVDTTEPSDLRLPITVRDENLDDVLSSQAQLSVAGQSQDLICGKDNIAPTGMAERLFELVISPQKLKPGSCTRVEVAVSKDFASDCKPSFAVPRDTNDIGRANYWIWEVSGEPQTNPGAAQGLLNTCQTEPSIQGTSTSMAQ